MTVVIGDQPGELARLFNDVDKVGVNIEDLRIEHATGRPTGLVHPSVAAGLATQLFEGLRPLGWRQH